jgi:F420-non-reducing hydrogenase iron-sulfur subunit
MSEEDVKIVGFCCNWCCYGGADTAGTARMQYPPNVRILRVMCSGRINPSMVLKAFKEGADGVFVGGCHMGDCHYDAGTKMDVEPNRMKNFTEFGIERKGLDSNGYPLQSVRSSRNNERIADNNINLPLKEQHPNSTQSKSLQF